MLVPTNGQIADAGIESIVLCTGTLECVEEAKPEVDVYATVEAVLYQDVEVRARCGCTAQPLSFAIQLPAVVTYMQHPQRTQCMQRLQLAQLTPETQQTHPGTASEVPAGIPGGCANSSRAGMVGWFVEVIAVQIVSGSVLTTDFVHVSTLAFPPCKRLRYHTI